MSLRTLLVTLALCLLPISELRGGLPFALSNDIPLPVAYLICVGANALVAPLVYLFLSSLHRLLERWQPYRRLFDHIVERARRKVHAKVEKYGYAGLILFVAIPLPITGAYTGTLGAWILGMDRRKTILAVFVGVIIAGIIVATVFTLGIKALYFFLK
ncbi:MAG: small multi-drug export protein [Spirochaetaceae bacterium]|nr:MAG: small multi-drug export protein [Spirochaetaceae bacterium]